jgi:hypothetical protein
VLETNVLAEAAIVLATTRAASGLAARYSALTSAVIATGTIVVPTAVERAVKTLAVAVVEENRA